MRWAQGGLTYQNLVKLAQPNSTELFELNSTELMEPNLAKLIQPELNLARLTKSYSNGHVVRILPEYMLVLGGFHPKSHGLNLDDSIVHAL